MAIQHTKAALLTVWYGLQYRRETGSLSECGPGGKMHLEAMSSPGIHFGLDTMSSNKLSNLAVFLFFFCTD